MNIFLFWLYGWHYLAHNLLAFSAATAYCDTCQAWEDESIRRTLEAHERRAPRTEIRLWDAHWDCPPEGWS